MNSTMNTEPWMSPDASALDPLVEERSVVAWRMIGADPTDVDVSVWQRTTAAFDLVAEVAFQPGRVALISQISRPPDSNDLEVTLGISMWGARGATEAEAEALARRIELTIDHPPFAAERIDPQALHDWIPESPGEMRVAHIRQRLWSPKGSELDQGLAVVSRFLPVTNPFGGLARTLASAPQDLRVRVTQLATELSLSDLQDISVQIGSICRRLEENPAAETRFDLERAKATLLDLRASMATPCYIVEIAVFSREILSETLLRSIAASITSEVDVSRRDGFTQVASRVAIIGGYDIERDPLGWDTAVRAILPLRGGTGPRELRDVITLFESPFGWPVPTGRGVPGVATTLPSRRVREHPEPEGVAGTTLGVDPAGREVRLPIEHRRRHVFVSGITGTGKSTAMYALAHDDIVAGRPFLWIDPHGTTATLLASECSEALRNVVVIDATNGLSDQVKILDFWDGSPAGWERIEAQLSRFADAIVSSLANVEWAGPVYRRVNAALLQLASVYGAELAEIFSLTGDSDALKTLIEDARVPDSVRNVILPLTRSNDGAETLARVVAKLCHVTSSAVRRVVAPAGGGVDLSEAVLKGRSIILSGVGLSKSELQFLVHYVLETVLSTKLTMGATPPSQIGDLYSVYVDEAHRFFVSSMGQIVAEGRKSGTSLILATQSIHQLPRELIDLLASVDATLTLRATPDTARFIADSTDLAAHELTRLPDLNGILNLRGVDPTAVTLAPMPAPGTPYPTMAPGTLPSLRSAKTMSEDQLTLAFLYARERT